MFYYGRTQRVQTEGQGMIWQACIEPCAAIRVFCSHSAWSWLGQILLSVIAGHIRCNPELDFAVWLQWEVKGPQHLARPSLVASLQTWGRVQQAVVITQQFTAIEGWGFHSSLLLHFPAPLTFLIPSLHWLWHSLAFQLTNLTEKYLICCCFSTGFSARLVSSSSSWKRRQHLHMYLHKDRTSSG